MFLGDKGAPSKYGNMRMNYDIVIDNEKMTLQKMSHNLGFYSIIYDGKIKDTEIVYDTDKKLLTGAGLLLRKKITPSRAYFSLVRVSTMNNIQAREKKSFLGECELRDEPSDFPVQIADGINKIFNNLFSINVVDIVKHCTPYIRTDISGNRYKIVSGTGYEAIMTFENLAVKDFRTGRKVKTRNFSLEMELNPNYERERQRILEVIERYCKEMVFINRNRFEISQVAVRVQEIPQNGEMKEKARKRSKKEIKAQLESGEENK